MIVSKVALTPFHGTPMTAAEGSIEVGVHADDRRAVGCHELVGRVGGVHCG